MTRIPVILALALLCVASSNAIAGAANATFRCDSAPDRGSKVTIEGTIPGDFAEFELRLIDSNGSIAMSDSRETISVITDFANGVFTLSVARGDQRNLSLYALPKTVKHSRGASRETVATFTAVLVEAPKPGYVGPVNYDAMIRNVRMSCKFSHSI
jgi:hypothetical protein